MNDRIVETGIKIDLHIHSKASHFKDGKKVSNLTIDNIDTLITKLNENEVNLCAITDHDNFDYNIYHRLKSEEGKQCIKKVLPGIEFSVVFETKVIHIITIFDDKDDTKLKEICKHIINEDGKPNYDRKDIQAFSEEKFLKIIKEINLNVIMIAHQKGSLSSKKGPRKNDVLSLGMEKFDELVFTDYFDSFEFMNRKNEIFNKYYLQQNKDKFKKNDIRFITGSDCHNWDIYPCEEDFIYTYLKCLPTFKGLSMAVTDYSRIKHVNSFFSTSDKYLKSIELEIGGKKNTINLSKGINVIIGDNSIGKSLLVHKITDYRYLKKEDIKKKYEKYLKENEITVNTKIDNEKMYVFDKQGGIREKFEKKTFKNSEFLKKYFPEAPNVLAQKEKVISEIKRFIEYMKEKNEYDILQKNLKKYKLVFSENTNSISFKNINIDTQEMEKNIKNVIDNYETIISELDYIMQNKITDKEDINQLKAILVEINKLYYKYRIKKNDVELKKEKISIINDIIRKNDREISDAKTDEDKAKALFLNSTNNLINNIIKLCQTKEKVREFKLQIKSKKLDISKRNIGKYRFVTKTNIEEISEEYLIEKIKQPMKKSMKPEKIDINEITCESLIEILPENKENVPVLEFYERLIIENIEHDFECKNIINEKKDDITKELSAGFNAKIYFDILSYQDKEEGIYIIDQPEDDVSQPAIKNYLLDNFKEMRNNRQIILITHNPQFIVNLDADNVIFLSKDNGTIKIQYGALEYESLEYKIIDIVSNNVDGGIEVINERWKRYEKNL